MARLYRRRRFYRRRRRGYGRRRKFYRKRVANASSRSSIRIRVPVEIVSQLSVVHNNDKTAVFTVFPYINVPKTSNPYVCQAAATTNALYQAYSNLYDEVKCDGMRVRVAVTSPVGASGTFTSLICRSAWDRRLRKQDIANTNQYPTMDALKEYSTHMSHIAQNNSVAKLSRALYPSDLQERSSYIESYIASGTLSIVGSSTTCTYNYYFENAAFTPCFMFGFETPDIDVANDRYINFLVSVVYTFTFRNPKFGAATVSKAVVPEMKTMDATFDDPEVPMRVGGPVAVKRPPDDIELEELDDEEPTKPQDFTEEPLPDEEEIAFLKHLSALKKKTMKAA